MGRLSRSPIKDRPLRLPGQSLAEERDQILEDKLTLPLVAAVLLLVLAGLEWWRYFVPQRPSPWAATFMATVGVAYLVWQVFKYRPRLRQLRQAIDGERAVGQYLERLREEGYHVFHDLIGDGFNIDHAVVGPAGVFTIETKTWSKPAKGEPRIDFDGERIVAAGYEPDRDPIVQAKAQSSWLRRLIEETTGRRVAVRPVVVFPGWFVKQSEGSTRDVWVLEPKALPAFLAHEENRLSPEDVKLVSYHVSRFIRAGEGQKT